MTRHQRQDRALGAVERVREVRETDSRVGLQQVLAEERAARHRLDTLTAQLRDAALPASSTPAELLAVRTALHRVGLLTQLAGSETETAAAVSAEARGRWVADRARLAAVEHLLEARAARRKVQAQRRDASAADDLAAQAWLRARGGHR